MPSDPKFTTSQGTVIGAHAEDAEMNAAIAQARNTLSRFTEQFLAQDPSCSGFMVKAFFPEATDAQSGEHLWVAVLSIRGQKLRGIVTSHPLFLTHLRPMEEVLIDVSAVTDWMFVQNDKLVGGRTVRLLRNRMTEEEREQHDAAYPFSFD